MSSGNDQAGDGIPTNMQGWNWFEAQVDNANKIAEAEGGLSEQDLDYHFEKCFNTQSGKIVLAHLQALHDRYKDFDPELGFYNGAAFGFWRSGQKSIIQYLKTRRSKIEKRGAKK